MLFAIASALLFACSFPKSPLFFLGFFFLIPILFVLEKKKKPGRLYAFVLFFVFSFISYLAILYWIPNVMFQYGGADRALSVIGLIALSCFLSIFSGIAGIFIDSVLKNPSPIALQVLIIPSTWIAKDLFIENIFGGFPWCLAGYSQYKNIFFIQIAELGGIHLVTFLLIVLNILFYRLIRTRDKRVLAAIVIIFLCVYSMGFYLFRSAQAHALDLETHRAGIIQPNTDNRRLHFEEMNPILDRMFNESRELAQKGAEFVVWPEHSVDIYPLQFETDTVQKYYRDRILDFVRSYVPLLAGFTDLKDYTQIYNSAILFEKDRTQKYDKVHLTPFGEYILFRKLLFFVKRITDEIADFTPGEKALNLEFQKRPVSTPICYEIIFPQLVRDFIVAGKGSELIVTISNDSWFGDTSAPYQHLSMAVFRSIENRRFMLRSTSNGVSGIITSTGEIVYRSSYNVEDHFIAEFKFIKAKTLFTRIGYLFPFLCVLILPGYYITRKIAKKSGL